MDEEQTTKEDQPESTAEDTGKGDKYETTPVIERAREERERMEKATEAQRIENDRTEAIAAKRMLGGGSEAGVEAKKEEETDEEYTARFQKGEVNPLEDDGIKP